MLQLKSIYVLLVLLAFSASVKGQLISDGRTWGTAHLYLRLVVWHCLVMRYMRTPQFMVHFQRQCILCGKPVRMYWDIQMNLPMMC